MEHYMAEFGQGYVQTAVLSENNAIKYMISAAGSCTQSTKRPYVKFQDTLIDVKFEQGLNVVIFDTALLKVTETKSFMLTNVPSSANRAFMTYMEALTGNKLAILISEGKMNTCSEVVLWFKQHNSSAWPTVWDINTFDVAYTAFYSTALNAITAEHSLCNDGKTKEPIVPNLDVVWDYYSDIGATGTPLRIAEFDGEKMSAGGQSVELLRLPSTELISPLSNYQLKSGDMVYFKFQLMVGKGIGTGSLPKGTTRCSIRWFKGSTIVKTTNVDANISFLDQWQPFERYLEVPANVDGFTVYFSKTDTSKEDSGGVRNVVISETTREETPLFRSAEFGVNGIRMNTLIDGKVDELLILNDSKTDDRGRVHSAEFREKQ